MNTRQVLGTLSLLAAAAAASPADAAATLIQAGADSRTQAGIGTPIGK